MSYTFNPLSGQFDDLGPSTTPGGSDTQVQFNDGGAFGGDAGLTYDKTTDTLSAGSLALTTALPISSGGTGQTTDAAAFQALGLGVMTAAGDMVRRTTVNTIARLPIGTAGRIMTSSGTNPTWSLQSSIAHGGFGSLTTGDDHTQYALLAGRSGGQTLIGDTAASGNLVLQSTANATKGLIKFGTAAAYDEANNRLGIGTIAPLAGLNVGSPSASTTGGTTGDSLFNGRMLLDPTSQGVAFVNNQYFRIYGRPSADISGMVDYTGDFGGFSGVGPGGTNRVIQIALSGIAGYTSGSIYEMSAFYLTLGFGMNDGFDVSLVQGFTVNAEWLDFNTGTHGVTEGYGGSFNMGGSAITFGTPTKKTTKLFSTRLQISNRYTKTATLGALDIQPFSGSMVETVDDYASINQDVAVMDSTTVGNWSFIRFTNTPTNPTGTLRALNITSTLPSVHAGKFAIGSTTTPTTNQLEVTGTANFTSLTSGRVTFAGTNGLLSDDADMTFATDTLTVKGLVVGTTKLTSYNGVATVSGGIPSQVATADLTAQGAAIAATTIYAVPAAGVGMYRVSWVATVTQAATTSSVLGGTNGFQLKYTDADDSVVKTSAPTTVTAYTSAGNTTGTQVSGSFVANCKASTNLQYLFDYTSVGATAMQYNLHIRVEALY